jgi:hypothetical protein
MNAYRAISAPLIPDLDNGYMWEAHFTPGNNFGIHGIWGWVVGRAGLGVLGKEKNILRRPEFELEIDATGVLIPNITKVTLLGWVSTI